MVQKMLKGLLASAFLFLAGRANATPVLPYEGSGKIQDIRIVGVSTNSFTCSTCPYQGSSYVLDTRVFGLILSTSVAYVNKPNTFTSSQTITAPGGLGVTYGIIAGTETLTALSSNTVVYVNGSTTTASMPQMGAGGLIIGTSVGQAPSTGTLTAGSNVTITNAAGSITIASSGGGTGISSSCAAGQYLSTMTVVNGSVTGGGCVAAGGGGTPGGSNTQLQYNNGGAFGGISSMTYSTTGGNELRLTALNASTTVQIIQAAASQTADLQEWQNSSGVVLSSVSANGALSIGPLTASTTAQIITGASGQTADFTDWRNNSGTTVMSVAPGTGATTLVVISTSANSTADLADFENSSATILSRIDANGYIGPPPYTTAQLGAGGSAPAPSVAGLTVYNSTIKDTCVSTGTAVSNWALSGSKGATGCY